MTPNPTTDAPGGKLIKPVILQVLPRMETGGVERGTVEIASAIKRAGWEAVVVSAGGSMVHELTRAGVRHIELPVHSKNPLVIRKNVARLEAVIREVGAHIVHARSRAPAWSAYKAARNTGARFVTTFHGTYNVGPFGLKKPYNAIMTKGERVIAISQFIADHIIATYKSVNPKLIRVVPRGVDFARFDPDIVSPERMIALSDKWRLPDDLPVIMLPGRLTRWKGQTVVIEGLSRLGHKDIRCLLVGSDQGRTAYREELEGLIERYGLQSVVHIVDDCKDMPAAYMLCDVVISASTDPEAFGRVIIEGQAMGRPVIATDHGGARETVIPEHTGWLIPPDDASAMAGAIKRALSISEKRRSEMAAEGMENARNNFSVEAMCEKTLQVYDEVLGLAPSKV